MIRRPGAYELIVGVTTDPQFGPLILFGQGGTAVEVIEVDGHRVVVRRIESDEPDEDEE